MIKTIDIVKPKAEDGFEKVIRALNWATARLMCAAKPNIEVKQEYDFNGQPICVVVEGFCNHFDTTTESRDFGQADQIKGDYVDDWRETTLCARCGAVYNEYDHRWEEPAL